MSQTLADDSEVMFDQPEESAGAMETEGSLQNRRRKETWLEATEPYRGGTTQNEGFRPTGRRRAGCHLGESHGTTEIRRVSKPIPELVYPTYVVEQPDYESEPVCMVSVNKQNSQVDQTDELLRKLLEALTPVRTPKATPLDKLTELLMSQIVKSEPAPPTPVEPTGLEALLQTYFTGQQSPGLGPRFRQMRRNWSDVKCFSCGKPGHSATRCPTLDVSFPFILPGWKAEKTPTGYLMISPKMVMDRCRAENEN